MRERDKGIQGKRKMENQHENGFAIFFLGVLVGIYGNWLISFLERLTFPLELNLAFYTLLGLALSSFASFSFYLISAFRRWYHPNLFWVSHVVVTLVSFVFQNSFIKNDQNTLVQNIVFWTVGVVIFCIILGIEWVSSGRRHRHLLDSRWRKPVIGILNDIGWDTANKETCTYTDIPPTEWKRVFDSAPNLTAKIVSTRDSFDRFVAILNPYGGVYPETNLRDLSVLKKILGFVGEGGTFINVADIPSYFAYDQKLDRRLDTTSPIFVVQNNQIQPLRLFEMTPLMKELGLRVLNTQLQQDFSQFSNAKATIVSERVAVVEPNMKSFIPMNSTANLQTSAFFGVKYGEGDFIFSLLFITRSLHNQNAKNIIKEALVKVTTDNLSKKTLLHKRTWYK